MVAPPGDTAADATTATGGYQRTIPGGFHAAPAQDGQAADLSLDWAAHVNVAKRKIRSELSLEDWTKFGFAEKRAAEFEALASLVQENPPPCAGVVPREEHLSLSLEQFWETYERKGLPCIISGTPKAEAWPACEKWEWASFFKRYAHAHFKVGKDDAGSAVRLRVDHFEQYMKVQRDDSPIYLFDNHFKAEKKELLQDYKVPSFFPDDYMGLVQDDRPPYRWVGVGPRRSGTVMHQDPLCTSAWNTLLAGRKLWLLLPPDTDRKVAKGVDVSRKGDDDEACNHFLDLLPRKRARLDPDFKPILCIQYPGDTIFVPGNWWHCVVNLDDTIAVTQNYCGRNNFAEVWRSCRKERPCWSQRWLRAMVAKRPELAEEALRLNSEDGFDMALLRRKNRARLEAQHVRRAARELRRARARKERERCASRPGGGVSGFDEEAWLRNWHQEQGAINSDSTASTTSSSSEDGSSSSEESSDRDAATTGAVR